MNNSDMDNKTKELELVLNEFFTLQGDNPKRNELDKFLTNYKSQADSYQHVRYYLTHSQNNYVWWFALLVIEHKVCKAWFTLSPQDQNETKNYLFEMYLGNKSIPGYITTKLGQIIADIGRNEFTQTNSHEYISNITTLIRNPTTSLRGINLLQYISQEFLTSKHILPQEKKNQLKKLLLLHAPSIISVLTEYLSNLFNQYAEKKSPFKPNNNNLLATANFAVGSPDTNTYTCSFSDESKLLTKAVFDALSSYFEWIPLNELLTPILLDVLFKYLRLDNNSIPALMCLNEILSKNCVPKEFEEFLMRIFHQIFSLLTDITTNPKLYNQEFLGKFTQFISLFVTNHLRRVENNPKFPISDFLSLLFQYSFLQSSSESFLNCIDIWSKFLDYLITQSTEKSLPAPSKYTDGLLLFQSELVKRTLFSFSKNVLSQIDDDEEDLDENENTETAFANYIKQCIEIVAKITELYPNKSLENLYPLFTENVTSFFGKTEETIKQGLIMDQNDEGLNHLLKDVTTILFLFSRLANQFVISFGQTYVAANFIFQKLLDMCSFSNSNMTFKFGSDWEKLHIQLLNTIRSFNYWLLEYGNQVRSVPTQQPDFDNNISRLIGIITPMFAITVPEEISIAAGNLLMTLVVISKPLNLLQSMENLIGNIHSICQPLSSNVQTIIYSAVSASILNPPSNVNLSHQWDVRRPKYSPFIKGITSSYLEIPQISGFVDSKLYLSQEVISRVTRILRILKGIIKSVPDVSVAKGILHDSIQDTLPVTSGLLRIYINRPDVLDPILDFFLTLFESLKTQVGIGFLTQVISTFLEVLGGDQISQIIMSYQNNQVSNNLVNKLLEILTFVIQTSGTSFESLLTSIIDFAMDKIYPAIVNTTSSILPKFFTLLYCILDNQWKHCKPHQINRVLVTFQTSFKSETNVNLFKQNLDSFEKLNAKVKLYEKISQMEQVFGCTFISVFFDILTGDQQSIQNEDIINTIYHFASINFDKFFNEFLNSYLLAKQQVTNEQKSTLLQHFTHEKDQPTFNINMNQFINDFCFYSYLNNNSK